MNEGLALIEAVRADPIVGPFLPELERFARPSVRLRADRERPRYVGESKVGGRPAAAVDFRWPVRTVDMPRPSEAWLASHSFGKRLLPEDGRSPYTFIAQIDLATVAPFDPDGLLPSDGMLLFFYDEMYFSDVDPAAHRPTSFSTDAHGIHFDERAFGNDQVDQVRVIHVPTGTELRLSDAGPHATAASALSPSADRTLPNIDCYCLTEAPTTADDAAGRVVLTPDAWSRLAELEYEHRANADIDQLLGWADNGAHGPSSWPAVHALSDVPPKDRMHVAEDARLLLQLSPKTYEQVGIRFGRTLYFYGLASDLRRGDFSRCWYDSD